MVIERPVLLLRDRYFPSEGVAVPVSAKGGNEEGLTAALSPVSSEVLESGDCDAITV